MKTSDSLAIAYADVDHSLHLAWSATSSSGFSEIYRQRLIGGAGELPYP